MKKKLIHQFAAPQIRSNHNKKQNKHTTTRHCLFLNDQIVIF